MVHSRFQSFTRSGEVSSGGGFTSVDASFSMVRVDYCRALLEALPSAKLWLRLCTDRSCRLSREPLSSLGVLLRSRFKLYMCPGFAFSLWLRQARAEGVQSPELSSGSCWTESISHTACCCRAFSMSRLRCWAWTWVSMSSAYKQICIHRLKRHGWVCSAGVSPCDRLESCSWCKSRCTNVCKARQCCF